MREGTGARVAKPTQTFAVLLMCALLFVAFSVGLKGYLSLGNLFILARNISILGILALGMAIVVIGRGLDLSQVASLACSTAIAIILMNAGYPTPLALLAGFLLAVAVGAMNGFLISVVDMPPLLTTLASSLAVLGVTRTTVVQHYVVYLAKGHDDFSTSGRQRVGRGAGPDFRFRGDGRGRASLPLAHGVGTFRLRTRRQPRRGSPHRSADPAADHDGVRPQRRHRLRRRRRHDRRDFADAFAGGRSSRSFST